MRRSEINRKSNETDIKCVLNLEGEGKANIKTDIPFLSHMLDLFCRFALIDLDLYASGDVEIDIHHLNEDTGIVLGQAIEKALGDRIGISRIGYSYVPMDEALSRVVIDFSGRPYFEFNLYVLGLENESDYTLEYAKQFLNAFSVHSKSNLHVDILRAVDFHHAVESVFKALGRSVYEAKKKISDTIPSTKGRID